MQLEYSDKNIHLELQRTTQALKAARLMRGWSRKRAAEKLGCTVGAVEQFENNRSNVSSQRLQRILSAYGYSEEEFAQIRHDPMRHLAELCELGKKDRSLNRKPRRNEYKLITKEVRALRILRKRRGISQCEASRLCGYIPRRFSHLEAGRIELKKHRLEHIWSCPGLVDTTALLRVGVPHGKSNEEKNPIFPGVSPPDGRASQVGKVA